MATCIQFADFEIIVNEDGPHHTEDLARLRQQLAPAPHTILHNMVVRAPLSDTLTVITATHEYIEAAGGIVRNQQGAVLMIFRRGYWDLPKGKIDKGEEAKAAAIREVKEETGIAHLEIVRELPPTYHTYYMYGKYAVKKTYWYAMTSSDTSDLTPQLEEDIEQAVWINPQDIPSLLPLSYANIRTLLQNELGL